MDEDVLCQSPFLRVKLLARDWRTRGSEQAMVLYCATYEVFTEEKAEQITGERLQRRGRRRRDN